MGCKCRRARNLCSVAEEHGITEIVFTSSVAVYGFTDGQADETAPLRPFNEYGRSKVEAERIYIQWQQRDPLRRSLVIVRPTVVFGEGNRGNVYNLLKQIADRRFVMVGKGTNIKSMAYVENVAAFIEFIVGFGPGIHIFNYADKPDLDMARLVSLAQAELGLNGRWHPSVPYPVGYLGGLVFDAVSAITGRRLPISSIRIKKFCASTALILQGHLPLALGRHMDCTRV